MFTSEVPFHFFVLALSLPSGRGFHLHLHFTHNHSQRVLLSASSKSKHTGLFCYTIKKLRIHTKKPIYCRDLEHLQCFVLNPLPQSKSDISPFCVQPLATSTSNNYHEHSKLWRTAANAIIRTDAQIYKFRLFDTAQQPRRPNSNTSQWTFRWNDRSTKACTGEGGVGKRCPGFCSESCKQEELKVIYITCVSAEEQEA